MTEKIFWKEPYLTKFETEVISIDNEIVSLKETIFFALSGGQDSDNGFISGYQVLEAYKSDKEIFYILPKEHTLSIGDHVVVEIDWCRRYKLMRLHSAAEIVLEIFRTYSDSTKIGAHISADKARLDFEYNGNINNILPLIKSEVQKIIDSNSKIISDFSDDKNEIRFWEIEGLAKVACGGTHPKYTGEIGEIMLKRKNIGKGKERIDILLVQSN